VEEEGMLEAALASKIHSNLDESTKEAGNSGEGETDNFPPDNDIN